MNTTSIMEMRKFVAPEFVFGVGALDLVGQYAKNLGAHRVLVVTDPGVIAAGWTDKVLASLGRSGVTAAVFSEVSPNPREVQVMSGAEMFGAEQCEAIVAIGGGSPMDCAKGIGIVHANERHILDYEGVDEVPSPGPPLICIPTTAGSSADVSQFAIVTDQKRQVKIAIISKTTVPDVALIDPETTTTMDPDLTACTGLDALAHAFEAAVSNARSPITDLHALEATRLVATSLIAAIENPVDLTWRSQMMLGSLYAGLAFSNASLGAVHAMAHALGGLLDSPHGEANALLLGPVMLFNFDAAPEQYRRLGTALGLQLESGREKEMISEALASLRTRAGKDQSLARLGVTKNEIPDLAVKAMNDACMATNPRTPTGRDIEEVYEKAL